MSDQVELHLKPWSAHWRAQRVIPCAEGTLEVPAPTGHPKSEGEGLGSEEVLFLNVLRQFEGASIDDLFDLFYEN